MGLTDKIKEKLSGGSTSSGAIGQEQITKALSVLKKYKDGKKTLEQRIIDDEQFYKMQHWDHMSGQDENTNTTHKPTTAWMLNSIINKHADLMDNYPEAICLPREQQDESDAKSLSEIIPVVMEYNDYEQTYSDMSWYYLKHGVCCQGVFWDSTRENGLGDIAIKNIDILNLFWEPGITDLQQSANIFYVNLVDNDVLQNSYPDLDSNKLSGSTIEISKYVYDDELDVSDKSVVVDWYYKKTDETGRTVLHYVKFVGDTILFASENDSSYANGFYEHGEYPFCLSVMYPEAGTPYGFGIISVCRDPQLYIDTLDGLMLDYVYKMANPRYWVKKDAGINTEDFKNWKVPLVEVVGDIDEEKVRQITIQSMGSAIQNLRQMKVDELKETSSNRDFSQGGTSSGVTSGAAIATLQEAGNKTSRDMIKGLYRGYIGVVRLAIELIRQFYDETRTFRITGNNGNYEFIGYSNAGIKDQMTTAANGEQYYRKPIFDIDVKAQKASPFAKMSQNETATNLYSMGIFNPQNAVSALGMLEIMDFEGKEKVKEYIMQQSQQMQYNMMQGYGQAAPNGNYANANNVQNPVSTAVEGAADNALNSYGKQLFEKAQVNTG